jgi:hypothetical protein
MHNFSKIILILSIFCVIVFAIVYDSKKSIKKGKKTQPERQITKHVNSYVYDLATANQNYSNRYMPEVELKHCPMSTFKQCTNNYLMTGEGKKNLEQEECVFKTDPLLVLP